MNQEIQPLFEVAMKVAVGSTPDPTPEVAALPKRRQFSAAYKRRIVRETTACQAPGEVGALLRREGLYSSHLTHWRKEVEARESAELVHQLIAANLRQGRHRRRATHPACRPRHLDALQARGAVARRPRCHQAPQPAACQR